MASILIMLLIELLLYGAYAGPVLGRRTCNTTHQLAQVWAFHPVMVLVRARRLMPLCAIRRY